MYLKKYNLKNKVRLWFREV